MAFNEINDEMFIVTVTCKIAIVNSYLFIKILSYALSPMRDVVLDLCAYRACAVLWYSALFRKCSTSVKNKIPLVKD